METASVPPCIFCDRSSLAIVSENALAFAIRDKFPVRPLHSLVLPKRHEPDGLLLSADESDLLETSYSPFGHLRS